MLEIITNPIFVSVIIMTVLCLLHMNVYISIIIASLVCGLMGGAGFYGTLDLFYVGTGGDLEGSVARLFMAAVAACMIASGLGDVLAPRVSKLLKGKPWVLLVAFVIIGACCESVISFGSSFCLVLIPPLLSVFNKYDFDRRKIVVAIICGLQIGYTCIPIGFGAMFQDIVASTMKENGVEGISYLTVAKCAWPVAIAMIIGVVLATFIYKKPRQYTPVKGITENVSSDTEEMPKWELKHTLTVVATIIAPAIQMITGSLQIGAFVALFLMVIFGIIKFKDMDARTNEGFMNVALVSFIMMAGCGYANVSKTVGDVEGLVNASISLLGGSKLAAAFVMLLLGLVVTMGIGTSWGTVPIVAVIMVPMCQALGFSTAATIMLIIAAACLGDAGSPASDETLNPSATFNLDGQHDHIWDTCVPSFICCNIPILVVCSIIACVM